jgi:hypothetical protein
MRKIAFAGILLSFFAGAQERSPHRHLIGDRTPLTASSSRPAREIASDFLKSTASDLGLTPTDLGGVYVAKEYTDDHNGVTHIVYRQQFQGIDVYNAAWAVNIDSQGRVLNAGGDLYPAPAAALPAPSSAFSAVRAAVRAVNPKAAARFAPFESRTPARKSNAIRFAAGADLTDDVEGRLIWYAVRGALRPGWLFDVVAEDGVTRYAAVVDSDTQQVVARRPRTYFDSPGQPRGLVFDQGSPQPDPKPGVLVTAAPPVVDRTMQSFTGDPTASPRGWVAGGETAGNNVVAGQNLLGTLFLTTPDTAKAADNNFSFPLQLGPGAPNPLSFAGAVTTNLFYWMNRAHDLHYAAGFTEAAGAFQAANFGRGGVEGDPMYAYSHFGAAAPNRAQRLNAFFTERDDMDGSPAMVAMFISDGGRGSFITDGSLDAYVMVHEYTHGVSSRLLPDGYDTFQVAAMGEAWSDFFALEYTLPENAPVDGVYAVGEYFDQSWGQGDVRSRPYSTNTDVNPLTFSNLGQVIPFPEVHADGEIWVEALWEMRANLIRQFGDKEGRRRVRTLVLDGMKFAPPRSSMVDMRDAILLADRADFKGESQSQIWAAFAKRGMGALAWSADPDTVHVKASYDLPSDKGKVAFYDDTATFGEPVRIIVQDSNYTPPSVRVQVTSGAGDLEDVVLKKTGSIYVGALPTSSSAAVTPQNGVLQLISADYISVYYTDYNAPGGAAQMQATIQAHPQYVIITDNVPFTFPNESAIDMSLGYNRVDLPFEFPFYDGKYRSVIVDENAGLFFRDAGYGARYAISDCLDSIALASATAITPLWVNMTSAGGAQPREGVYMSHPTPNAVTFRWAGETFTRFAGAVPGSPVNVAATLYDDGSILFQYGSGNAELASALTFPGCSPGPTVGLSPGRDTIALNIALPSYTNARSLRFDPPFGANSEPVATIESPSDTDDVRDVLTVKGVAYDRWSPVTRVDVMVDGKAVGTATPSITRSDVCSQQKDAKFCAGYQLTVDLAGRGFKPGPHSVRLRTTNSRAGFTDGDAVAFTMNAGRGGLPYGAIDAPAAGAEVSGTVAIRGYAISDTLRILSVDTLIDGISYGPTSYNQRRDDICGPLSPKPPNCPAPGFVLNLNTRTALPPIADGGHSVQIRVRDETGRYTLIPDAPVPFTVNNGPYQAPVGALTAPRGGDRLTGVVRISGYSYSPGSTIRGVLLVIDGDSYGTIPYGEPAENACSALPDVTACPNIGFAIDFDTARLSNGPHIIQVFVTDGRGNSTLLPAAGSPTVSVVVSN